MGVVDTSQNFNSTDTITSAKLNNIIDDTFFTANAISGSTLQIVSPGKLAVTAGGITANELASGAVTPAKLSTGGPSWTASSVTLPSNTSVSGTISATGFTGPLTGDVTGNVTGSAITLGTSVSASGTSVDFTSVPSWVKKITVILQGVSTNGTSGLMVQLGTSSGFVTSGYSSNADLMESGVNPSNWTTGFGLENGTGMSAGWFRNYTCTIVNISGNNWVYSTIGGVTVVVAVSIGGGSISLGGSLDRVRLTTLNGTDTFDAGTVNVMYE